MASAASSLRGLARQIRADRERESARTHNARARDALDNTLIEVCGGTAYMWPRLMLKEILFLQQYSVRSLHFESVQRLFLSLARPTRALPAPPICDFKLFMRALSVILMSRS